MGANATLSREALRHVMALHNLSQEAFALNAGAATSSVSDAIQQRGRHLEIDWVLAQPDAFVKDFFAYIESKRGLTAESKKAQQAKRIGELVTLLVETGCSSCAK